MIIEKGILKPEQKQFDHLTSTIRIKKRKGSVAESVDFSNSSFHTQQLKRLKTHVVELKEAALTQDDVKYIEKVNILRKEKYLQELGLINYG